MKHQGFVKHIKSKLEAIVQNYAIPVAHANDSSPFGSVYAVNDGDVMSVADVMRMADVRGAAVLDQPRPDGTTMRTQGAVLSMSIEYDNTVPWDYLGKAPPHYTITCQYLPMRYYKIVYEELMANDERRLLNVHGLLIIMRIQGKIRVFSWMHLMTILTTAMVSLAMASTLTDYLMLYLFKLSPQYNIIKFQPTQDFGAFGKSLAAVEKKPDYNPLTNKAVPHADVLNNCAESAVPPSGDNLLYVLLKFEQRLNRLDGMDARNAVSNPNDLPELKDAAARTLDIWELNYEKNNFGVQME